jgi:amphi-Trp domain-containing protein
VSHGKFKYESQLRSEDVAGYLESLAAGIRQRDVHLESGSDSVSLRVADEVSFECIASENPEKARAGFTLCIEWRTASHESARRSPALHILSGCPADEEAVYAEDFVDRAALTHSSGRV